MQTANLCFQCNKLQWLTLHMIYLSTAVQKKVARVRPLPLDFRSVFCLSQFTFEENLEEEALGLTRRHAVPVTVLSHAA